MCSRQASQTYVSASSLFALTPACASLCIDHERRSERVEGLQHRNGHTTIGDESEGERAGALTSAAAERVAENLRERIVKGEFPPGSRIIERKLSAELKVSRTPIREALKLLHADGLIEISMHRGAQVTRYSGREAKNLFELIAVMESLAAGKLVGVMTPALLDRLESLHSQMLDRYKVQNTPEYFDINSLIHDTIVEECGNPILVDSYRRLIVRARRGRYLAIMVPARWRQAIAEHEGLMEALRTGDAEAASRVWLEHLRHTGETIEAVLDRIDS